MVAQMKTYSVVIIGAGRRGSTYANEMLKLGNKFKVVGVADPIKERRDFVQSRHGFSDDMCFNSWEDILAKPKMADIAVFATMGELFAYMKGDKITVHNFESIDEFFAEYGMKND